ncbi:MAG: restriction endonuclease subunit S [Acidimicrobiaceae bacterium]|nr:restriction endonuclease subunit S [Acidimicrobiaceae bacterium]
MSRVAVPLGELMQAKKRSVDPRKHPDEEFELFSIPAFDAGASETVCGSDVGSSKQVLERHDVLLSKIVPHIRRSWVVEPSSECRMIGSSEWIVFRSDRFEPKYLRHVLISDHFHQAFMQTVAGVGGSLLRARPTHVAEIEIPLPQIEEQRRIAAVLDAAEALRAKRRQALAKLDELPRAVFHEMFGDPVRNERGWPLHTLRDVCLKIQIGPFGSLLHKSDYVEGGIPLVNPMHIVGGTIQPHREQTISLQKYAQLKVYCMEVGDVVMGRRGEMGRVAIVSECEAGFLCGSGSLYMRPDPGSVTSPYMAAALSSARGRRHLENSAQGVTMLNLNSEIVGGFELGLPPIELQREL